MKFKTDITLRRKKRITKANYIRERRKERVEVKEWAKLLLAVLTVLYGLYRFFKMLNTKDIEISFIGLTGFLIDLLGPIVIVLFALNIY